MKTTYSVLSTFNKICAEEISRGELNFLIELFQNFAFTYFKYRYKNLGRILLAEDVTLQELSIDAISPLFERDEMGVFIKIKSAFEKWQPPIFTEEQALFFLNRLVSKSVEKYVALLLRQSDPFFSKILDSINYLIEKQGYKRKQIIGTTYIVEDVNLEKIGTLPDSKFISELPIELFADNSKIISKTIEYIKINPERERAIPLNAFVLKIKQIKASSYNLPDSTTNGNQTEIDSITSKAIEVTINKMNESYLQKDKINFIEANAIKKAVESIIYDMRDGGINPGVHKYLIEQIPDLTFENYEKKYQNIFEYLIKILKKEIALQLSN